MVVPLIPLAIIGAGLLVGGGTAVGLAFQEPDKQISNVTQQDFITKNNEVVIGEGAKVGELIIRDTITTKKDATVSQTSSKGIDPLILGIGAGAAALILLGGRK